MSAKKLLRPAIGLGISAVCLFLVARSVPFDEVGRSMREMNPLVLAPAILLYFAGTAVRSLRWQKLLPGYSVPFGELFRALTIGLMINDVLPGRLGEVARIFLVSRHGVPVGTSLAAIVVERVLDGIALTALLVAGIVLSGASGWMLELTAISAGVFAVVIIVLFWAGAVPGPARWLGLRCIRIMPERLHEPLERLMESGLTGLRAMGHPVAAIQVLLLSLGAWILEAGMYRVIMTGFQVPGSMAASVMGAGVANLATLVPSSPGYVGTFDVALQRVLDDVFNWPAVAAVAFTFTVHLVLIVPVVLLGLFFLWRENISIPELTRRPRSLTGDGSGGAENREARPVDVSKPVVESAEPDGAPVAGPPGRLL